jgi:splicing factor 3B subunit 3
MLPVEPIGVWTVKKNISDLFDAYIVVPFTNVTLVLSIGETIEEVSDSQSLAVNDCVGLGGEKLLPK